MSVAVAVVNTEIKSSPTNRLAPWLAISCIRVDNGRYSRKGSSWNADIPRLKKQAATNKVILDKMACLFIFFFC